MKRIKSLTQSVLRNIASRLGNEKKMLLLKSLSLSLNGQPISITVTRIGEIDKFTLGGKPQVILIYVEGHGGVVCHISENSLFLQGEVCPMQIRGERVDEIFLDINPSSTTIYPEIKYNTTNKCYGYGGYIHMKEKFVRVDSIDHNNPIVLTFPACRIDISEILELGHPNLILVRKEIGGDRNHTNLLCFDTRGADYSILSHNWFQKRTKRYPEMIEIVDQQETTYLAKFKFEKWYDKEFKRKTKYA